MKTHKLNFTLLLGIYIFNNSCNQSTVASSMQNKDSLVVQQIEKNDTAINTLKFKRWVIDTLRFINKEDSLSPVFYEKRSDEQNVVGHKKVKYLNTADTSVFQINEYYSLEAFGKQFYSDENVNNVLLLLKEYDEIPNKKFKLKFNVKIEYTPSPVKGLSRDFIYEIEDLEVDGENENVKTSFGYIRGRLSGKKVVKKNIDGTKQETQFDFIWESNNKLIKKEIR